MVLGSDLGPQEDGDTASVLNSQHLEKATVRESLSRVASDDHVYQHKEQRYREEERSFC